MGTAGRHRTAGREQGGSRDNAPRRHSSAWELVGYDVARLRHRILPEAECPAQRRLHPADSGNSFPRRRTGFPAPSTRRKPRRRPRPNAPIARCATASPSSLYTEADIDSVEMITRNGLLHDLTVVERLTEREGSRWRISIPPSSVPAPGHDRAAGGDGHGGRDAGGGVERFAALGPGHPLGGSAPAHRQERSPSCRARTIPMPTPRRWPAISTATASNASPAPSGPTS